VSDPSADRDGATHPLAARGRGGDPPADGDAVAPGPETEPPGRPGLPPDPAAYDSPRNAQARARGLEAPYIAGGRDPEPEKARREERFYVRLLLAMVLIVVLSGFVLGFIGALFQQVR
jgi:hypothetical protein